MWRPSRCFHKIVFKQCTIAPIMQVATREQFHNDVEHTPRTKIRFATEDDVQIIADSSRRTKSENSPELLLNAGMTLNSWSVMVLSSLFFVSSVMISKPELKFFRENSFPGACLQLLRKSSGCCALQALRRTHEAPTVEAQTHMMAFGRWLGIPRPSLGCQPDSLGSAYYGGRSSAAAEREIIWDVGEESDRHRASCRRSS